ncbi:MAG TPA: hypothetical protein VKK79_22030 [Candidatus Lokiarchaeia archaeon]|nr:hypothetical protein [Candidatus Lokiarchaeia archaeon]
MSSSNNAPASDWLIAPEVNDRAVSALAKFLTHYGVLSNVPEAEVQRYAYTTLAGYRAMQTTSKELAACAPNLQTLCRVLGLRPVKVLPVESQATANIDRDLLVNIIPDNILPTISIFGALFQIEQLKSLITIETVLTAIQMLQNYGADTEQPCYHYRRKFLSI